jgi:pantothenate kinase
VGSRLVAFADAEVLLLEGVFVLRASSAASGLMVYLEVQRDEARRRIIARDLARGRSQPVIEHRIRERYFPSQDRYQAAFAPAARAHVVIDNGSPERPRCLRFEVGAVPPLLRRALKGILKPES